MLTYESARLNNKQIKLIAISNVSYKYTLLICLIPALDFEKF